MEKINTLEALVETIGWERTRKQEEQKPVQIDYDDLQIKLINILTDKEYKNRNIIISLFNSHEYPPIVETFLVLVEKYLGKDTTPPSIERELMRVAKQVNILRQVNYEEYALKNPIMRTSYQGKYYIRNI